MRYQYTSSGFNSSFKKSLFFVPKGIKIIITINIVVFVLLELSDLKFEIFRQFGLIPYKTLFNGKIWQPFTYMFLHDGFLHIFLNMLFLWMFGKDVEQTWGEWSFYKYYLITGVGAGLLNAFIHFNSNIPVVGASGAVFGVLLSFGVLFPNRIVLLYGIVPMKVKHLILGLALIAFFSSILASDSRISHLTHLSGMITGWFYLNYKSLLWKCKLFIRKSKPSNIQAGSKKSHISINKKIIQRRVDEILEKLNDEGWENLTESEQKFLYNASEKYSKTDHPN